MRGKNNNLPEVPKGWVWTRLGEIARIRNGFAFKSRNYQNEGIFLIRQSNLEKRRVNVEKAVHLPNQFLNKYSEFIIRKGDILVGMSGSIGKSCIYDLETPALQNQRTGLIQLLEPRMKQFIRYYLDTLEGQLLFLAKGVGVQNISAREIESCPIPIPPLPEQRRIITKIEELFTKLDAGVEALKKVKAQLKRYRQAVLKYAFEGKLTEEWRVKHKSDLEPASVLLERIKEERRKNGGSEKGTWEEVPPLETSDLPELPQGWVWTSLGEIADIVTGTTPTKSKKEYYGTDFPFFKPTDLNDGYHVRKSRDGLSKKGIEKARLLPDKSTLVTCIGATIGKTGFIRAAGACNQQINSLIPERNVFPEFVYFMCVSPQFQRSIITNASATTLPILNKSKFEKLEIPLPPLREQQTIVEEIERHFSGADEVDKVVEQSLSQTRRLRQSILKKAFEGKLVPQDPSDEPVEKLLERVKMEKARRERGRRRSVGRELTQDRGG